MQVSDGGKSSILLDLASIEKYQYCISTCEKGLDCARTLNYTRLMIGNKEDAKRALMGEGKYIGEGCTRKCFLIDDVVYKVEFCPAEEMNFFEAENLYRLSQIPNPPVVIPDCTLWDVTNDGETVSVIAMPYYEGSETGMCYECEFGGECIDEDCVPENIIDWLSANRIDDSAYGNFIFTGLHFVLIDAAY